MKIKKYLEKTLFFSLVLFLPAGANAIPLGSATISVQSGYGYGSDSSILFYTAFTSDHYEGENSGTWPWPSPPPFFKRDISPSDIGYTFIINQNDYAYWDDMMLYALNDGTQDFCAYDLGADDRMSSVSWNFTPSYNGNGIDFENYLISSLLVTIDELSIFRIEEWDGNKTYCWQATWTITADGQPVPEPATLFLISAGLLGCAGFKKKFKNQKVW